MTALRTILATFLSPKETDAAGPTLALLPRSVSTRDDPKYRLASGVHTVPDELLPSGYRLRKLPAGPAFASAAISAIKEERATRVLIVPPQVPFRSLPPEWQQEHRPFGIAEMLARDLLAEPDLFSEGGPAHLEQVVLMVHQSFCRSQSTGSWRAAFFPQHSAVIVEQSESCDPCGASLPSPLHFVVVSLWRDPGPVKFFKIDADVAAAPEVHLADDLHALIGCQGGRTRFGYVYRGALEPENPTVFDYYSEETRRQRQRVDALGESVPLREVAEIFTGFRGRPSSPQRSSESTRAIEYITGRDVTEDGRVDLGSLQSRKGYGDLARFMQDGDWCIREVFRSSADRGLIVGIYEGDGRRVAIGPGVIVVRPRPSLTPVQRQVLLSFLRSPVAGRLIDASAPRLHGSVRVSPRTLQAHPVPLADDEITTALENISEARRAFQDWDEECRDAENAIWLEADANESRASILRVGQLARQRFRAGRQVESLDFRVRTQFPHPIAYLWREVQVSGPHNYLRFRSVLKAAEGYCCFMAMLGIVVARRAEARVPYFEAMGKRVAERTAGAGFGDWYNILVELNSKSFKKVDRSMPFLEVTQLFNEASVNESLRLLVDRRNQDSHRGTDPQSITHEDVTDVEEALQTLYAAADFVTDYRLICLTETNYDSIVGTTKFKYRDLTGDNTLAPLLEGQAARSDLEAGSLYLVARTGELLLLRPFLHYLECPKCHAMSTFHLDKCAGSGNEVMVKSIERGSSRIEQLADQFRHVGLLSQ